MVLSTSFPGLSLLRGLDRPHEKGESHGNEVVVLCPKIGIVFLVRSLNRVFKCPSKRKRNGLLKLNYLLMY